jgi:hypothetical protein
MPPLVSLQEVGGFIIGVSELIDDLLTVGRESLIIIVTQAMRNIGDYEDAVLCKMWEGIQPQE